MKFKLPFKIKVPEFIKKRKKTSIAVGVVLLLVLFLIFKPKAGPQSTQLGEVTKQDIQQTVLATGQVVSGTDLDLSFQGSGIVRTVNVKEGDKVIKGQLLASLDQSAASASYTIAKGSLAQAQANYEKLIQGATAQSIQIVKDSIAIAEQDLANAYSAAPNTLNSAYATMYNAYSTVQYFQNTYFTNADQQGLEVAEKRIDIKAQLDAVKPAIDKASQTLNVSDIESAASQMSFAVNAVYNDVAIVRADADQGSYYVKISTTDKDALDTQKASLVTASTNITTLQHTFVSLKLTLQKAKNQLDVTIAPPTQAEIDAAQAQVLSAQGQVNSALATMNNAVIRSPVSGTITEVDIKVGQFASSASKAIVLQDVNDLHTEADVSEANIATLQLGQTIDYTFDALGPDEHFSGKVLTINPASTVVSGVVNYKIKGNMDNAPNVKPGMTANMTILVASKEKVLTVSSTAVINKNGKQFVRVVDNEKKKTYHEVEVKTGLQADGGLVEIISGLQEGEKIVTYQK